MDSLKVIIISPVGTVGANNLKFGMKISFKA